MTEKEYLEQYIAEGFRAAMVLRDPLPEELRDAPHPLSGITVKELPLAHPDGRELMYYLTDPIAIKFAESLVQKERTTIGYRL
ncbi:MAG TPA: hypothetical protein VGB89_14855, partial [Bacteroidota bacterium]